MHITFTIAPPRRILCRVISVVSAVVMTIANPLHAAPARTHAAVDSLNFLRFRSTAAADTLPIGWVIRAVRGARAPTPHQRDSANVHFWRISGANRAAWFVRELPQRIPPTSGTLTCEWRVLLHPKGSDLRAKATDDAAIRIFVVFERRGLFDRVPRTLFYTSGIAEPAGYERESHQSDKLRIIRIGPEQATTEWIRTVIDPFADYRRFFGNDGRAIEAIGIMQDTEQTGSAAVADIRMFTWK